MLYVLAFAAPRRLFAHKCVFSCLGQKVLFESVFSTAVRVLAALWQRSVKTLAGYHQQRYINSSWLWQSLHIYPSFQFHRILVTSQKGFLFMSDGEYLPVHLLLTFTRLYSEHAVHSWNLSNSRFCLADTNGSLPLAFLFWTALRKRERDGRLHSSPCCGLFTAWHLWVLAEVQSSREEGVGLRNRVVCLAPEATVLCLCLRWCTRSPPWGNLLQREMFIRVYDVSCSRIVRYCEVLLSV